MDWTRTRNKTKSTGLVLSHQVKGKQLQSAWGHWRSVFQTSRKHCLVQAMVRWRHNARRRQKWSNDMLGWILDLAVGERLKQRERLPKLPHWYKNSEGFEARRKIFQPWRAFVHRLQTIRSAGSDLHQHVQFERKVLVFKAWLMQQKAQTFERAQWSRRMWTQLSGRRQLRVHLDKLMKALKKFSERNALQRWAHFCKSERAVNTCQAVVASSKTRLLLKHFSLWKSNMVISGKEKLLAQLHSRMKLSEHFRAWHRRHGKVKLMQREMVSFKRKSIAELKHVSHIWRMSEIFDDLRRKRSSWIAWRDACRLRSRHEVNWRGLLLKKRIFNAWWEAFGEKAIQIEWNTSTGAFSQNQNKFDYGNTNQ